MGGLATDISFYIWEFNILVPTPSVSKTFSSQDSLAHARTHVILIAFVIFKIFRAIDLIRAFEHTRTNIYC